MAHTFRFTAMATDSDKSFDISVTKEEDPNVAYVDLADKAEEEAHERAAVLFNPGEDFEVISA